MEVGEQGEGAAALSWAGVQDDGAGDGDGPRGRGQRRVGPVQRFHSQRRGARQDLPGALGQQFPGEALGDDEPPDAALGQGLGDGLPDLVGGEPARVTRAR